MYAVRETALEEVFRRDNIVGLGNVLCLCHAKKCKTCRNRFPCGCIDKSKCKSLVFDKLYDVIKDFDTIVCYAVQSRVIASLMIQLLRNIRKLIVFEPMPKLNPCTLYPVPAKPLYHYEKQCTKRRFIYCCEYNYAELTVLSSVYSADYNNALAWCVRMNDSTKLTLEDFQPKEEKTGWVYLDPMAKLSDLVVYK